MDMISILFKNINRKRIRIFCNNFMIPQRYYITENKAISWYFNSTKTIEEIN